MEQQAQHQPTTDNGNITEPQLPQPPEEVQNHVAAHPLDLGMHNYNTQQEHNSSEAQMIVKQLQREQTMKKIGNTLHKFFPLFEFTKNIYVQSVAREFRAILILLGVPFASKRPPVTFDEFFYAALYHASQGNFEWNHNNINNWLSLMYLKYMKYVFPNDSQQQVSHTPTEASHTDRGTQRQYGEPQIPLQQQTNTDPGFNSMPPTNHNNEPTCNSSRLTSTLQHSFHIDEILQTSEPQSIPLECEMQPFHLNAQTGETLFQPTGDNGPSLFAPSGHLGSQPGSHQAPSQQQQQSNQPAYQMETKAVKLFLIPNACPNTPRRHAPKRPEAPRRRTPKRSATLSNHQRKTEFRQDLTLRDDQLVEVYVSQEEYFAGYNTKLQEQKFCCVCEVQEKEEKLENGNIKRIDPVGNHYDRITCEGCKSFFKRTVQNKHIHKCAASKNCNIIGKYNRTSCRFCRARKCLLAGMSVPAVREDHSPGGRTKAEKYKPIEFQTPDPKRQKLETPETEEPQPTTKTEELQGGEGSSA